MADAVEAGGGVLAWTLFIRLLHPVASGVYEEWDAYEGGKGGVL